MEVVVLLLVKLLVLEVVCFISLVLMFLIGFLSLILIEKMKKIFKIYKEERLVRWGNNYYIFLVIVILLLMIFGELYLFLRIMFLFLGFRVILIRFVSLFILVLYNENEIY